MFKFFFDDFILQDPGPNPVGKLEKKILKEWTEKTVDAMFIRDCVPKKGSIVYCNLMGAGEHTGIYVGNEKIVHLNGDGEIEKVGVSEFLGRMEGWNPAFTVFCPVDSYGDVICRPSAATRALKCVGDEVDYNLLTHNCHCFSMSCFTGRDEWCPSFTVLEEHLRKDYDFARWRACKL